MTSRLSLWATPRKGSKNQKGWIQASTEAASMVSQAVSAIDPHITLASWVSPYPDVNLGPFAKRTSFRLKPLPSVQFDDSYWMCIFVEMNPNSDLLHLRELAETIRPDIRSGSYRPHASLVYGNVDSKTKFLVARGMDCFIPSSFACERVCLIDTTNDDHKKWKLIAEVNLKSEGSLAAISQ